MKIEFKQYNIYHAQTLEEAKWILKQAHEQGMSWGSGNNYLEKDWWDDYKELTCYNIYAGNRQKVDTFTSSTYTIIEVKDLMNSIKGNSLPEKWAVCADDSDEFKDLLKWIQEKEQSNSNWGYVKGFYYGRFSGGSTKGSNGYEVQSGKPDVKILSPQEWVQLKNNKQINKQLKSNNYEQNTKGRSIKICRPISTITRGTPIRGNRISGRESKITITKRYLGNKAISI